jgi:hypothetical protein
MFKLPLLLFALLAAFSQIHHQTMDNQNNITIHKKWRFVKCDVINVSPNTGLSFDSDLKLEYLDLSAKSTLKYVSDNGGVFAMPYKTKDNTIFIPAFDKTKFCKIYKLTETELTLMLPPGNRQRKGEDFDVIIIFNAAN